MKSYGLSSVPFKKAIRALQEKYLFTYSAIIGEIGMKFNHLISYIPTGRVDLVWKELHNEFDRNDASTIRALKFEFERFEMKSNESVSEFITKIKSSEKKSKDCKVLVSQEDMLNVLLHGVISDFNPVVEALELKSKLTRQLT